MNYCRNLHPLKQQQFMGEIPATIGILPSVSYQLRSSFFPSHQCQRRLLAVVNSVHSKAKIIKPNRRTTYGRAWDPYLSCDEEEDDWDLENEDDKDDKDEEHDDAFYDDSDEGDEVILSRKQTKGTRRINIRTPTKSQKLKVDQELLSCAKKYPKLNEEIEIDVKWVPLLDYLVTFGLKETHLIQMYERHPPSLQVNLANAKERLNYLFSEGVKQRDIKRILLRQPQILEYTVENNLKPHIQFLINLGIPSSKIGQIIAVSPSLFSYSVENSLTPTVSYLVEKVGINREGIGKVVQLSPQILLQRIDVSWSARYVFLSKEIGASKDCVMRMVKKHPQLLHYSIDSGLLPRINFLRSIGMRNSDILKVLTSLTQVLSLSLDENLRPKYKYLVNELGNEARSLTKYPMYLSLSLEQRIRPRHRFLVAMKKAPKGPFPLGCLLPTDESFCENWAGTSVDKYLAFRHQLLLQNFANKYER